MSHVPMSPESERGAGVRTGDCGADCGIVCGVRDSHSGLRCGVRPVAVRCGGQWTLKSSGEDRESALACGAFCIQILTDT